MMNLAMEKTVALGMVLAAALWALVACNSSDPATAKGAAAARTPVLSPVSYTHLTLPTKA